MKESIWYWEYLIKVWDIDKNKEDFRAGIVAATTMAEAMASIEYYYSTEIMEVNMLKAITDIVIDFDFVNCYGDFDFTIYYNKK